LRLSVGNACSHEKTRNQTGTVINKAKAYNAANASSLCIIHADLFEKVYSEILTLPLMYLSAGSVLYLKTMRLLKTLSIRSWATVFLPFDSHKVLETVDQWVLLLFMTEQRLSGPGRLGQGGINDSTPLLSFGAHSKKKPAHPGLQTGVCSDWPACCSNPAG
jgi:hypothetical protein